MEKGTDVHLRGFFWLELSCSLIALTIQVFICIYNSQTRFKQKALQHKYMFCRARRKRRHGEGWKKRRKKSREKDGKMDIGNSGDGSLWARFSLDLSVSPSFRKDLLAPPQHTPTHTCTLTKPCKHPHSVPLFHTHTVLHTQITFFFFF